MSSYINSNPDIIFDKPYYTGDVVQWVNHLTEGKHTMYISGYGIDASTGKRTFLVTYHTGSTLNKSLLEICRDFPGYYYQFFHVTQSN